MSKKPIYTGRNCNEKMYRLYADYGKRVTKDGKEYYTVSPLVPEDELEEWYEE